MKLPELPEPRFTPIPLQINHVTVEHRLAVTMHGEVTVCTPEMVDDIRIDNAGVAEAVLCAAGYPVPSLLPIEILSPLATSVVRTWWFKYFRQTAVPEEEIELQRRLYGSYLNAIKKRFKSS